uniref:Excision repair cross-complementation group 6-like n=1 Tax=Neogobius melanostomus TaxID=47308 RepID=A0A8C6TB48_9GOBI
MGLGKTIQVISFLSGMYDAEHVKSTVLVVPTSLITNWTKEFAKWTPGMRVKEYHGPSKSERTRNLEKVQRRGGVLVTTYNMLLNNWQTLASHRGAEFTWDYMILDEAHKIKSSATKTAKSATAIPSKNRLLLTGTPVQNNLREMWALFDFACQGTLLGTAKTFKTEYENPITRAREKDATPGEKALGSRMSENLMAIICPHFLRRTKAEVQHAKPSVSLRENGNQSKNSEDETSGAKMPKLTRKNDLIVWTYLSAVQEDVYRQFLSLDQIKELLMTTKSPLAQLTILKKLCDHPRLLSAVAMSKLGLDESEAADSEGDSGHDIANVPDDTLISESGKMVFLFALLERLREEGHRTLVFAHYRKVLDIIEKILNNRGYRVLRMDGTITHTAERERRITLFQKDRSYTVFLLTTQVGGVGITLTAASRVVIYDPSWNPATDAQAVDRAYRIGQKENVVVYRLITCGTVEEKIYRRQVFKDSLIRQNTGDKKDPFRYFSKQELRELFTLEETKSSSTQLQLQTMHSRQRRTDAELDEHIAHLHAMEMFGISDHDLMFSVNAHQDEAPEDQEEQLYIQGRVQKAQELMKAESELQLQLGQSMASSTEAAWLRAESHPPPRERKQRSPRQVSTHQIMDQMVIDDSFEGVMDTSSSHKVHLMQNGIENASVNGVSVNGVSVNGVSVNGVSESVVEEETSNHKLDRLTRGDSLTSITPNSSLMALDVSNRSPPRNKRLSTLQSSFKTPQNVSKSSHGLDSFEGDFNLQLDDDSDAFSERDIPIDEKQTEAEEREILSRLKLEGSFDVDKSLAEHQRERSVMIDVSEANESIITMSRKKNRVARIYSDDEEEEEEEGEEENKDFERSFHMLGASTPKLNRSAKAGNTSVASRRSLVQSMIDDLEEEGESGETEEEGESGETEEEETKEETSADEGEESEEMQVNGSYDMLALLDGEIGLRWARAEGRELVHRGNHEAALGYFLRAIDIKPGDAEIQLLTIQIYRQLSARK